MQTARVRNNAIKIREIMKSIRGRQSMGGKKAELEFIFPQRFVSGVNRMLYAGKTVYMLRIESA
jgi:hypothetical protein